MLGPGAGRDQPLLALATAGSIPDLAARAQGEVWDMRLGPPVRLFAGLYLLVALLLAPIHSLLPLFPPSMTAP